MMQQHKLRILLLLLFIVSSESAVRKNSRPFKPAKTFPRTNVTPQPLQSTPATDNVAEESFGPPLAFVANPSKISSDNEIPKPINLQQPQQQQPPQPQLQQQPQPQPQQQQPQQITIDTLDAVLTTAASSPANDAAKTESPTSIPDDGIEEECDPDMIGFELTTGYVQTAPSKLLDTLPGMLMLTDCLEACQTNESCSSVNYETGLCVLFKSNADKMPGALSRSQFPVFTIYAQKSCLGVRPCSKAWCVDRVQGHRLVDHVRASHTVYSRRDCLELCLGETEYTCRSANFYHHSGLCELSEMDRITLTGTSNVEPYDGADYLENNCAEEPSKLCEFRRISGKILKTVDSVYQDVNNIDECRDLCLNSPYRCHSYDYNDTGDMVCRLSHHSRATLTDVIDPYLDVTEAATYELSSCYNVSIECRAGEMITKIRTSKLFDGKVYAKGSPKSCSVNVNSSLEFDFRMGYNDLECNVRQSAYGRYMNDIVIQHHDMIVTSSDLGLAVSCQYDLTNKTVSNDVDLGVTGEIESSLSEEIIIDSPNVMMKITSRDGGDMKRVAEVGDPLALRFEIMEQNSPYEIFVRELVAMDGTDNAEITLIDANGCPTDQYIMGNIHKLSHNRKVLLSQFDAFKFPSSEVVQFRALVTPCIPRCEPVICNNEDSASGELKSLVSYGRRRRRSIASIVKSNDGGMEEEMHQISSDRWRRDVSYKPADDNILLVQSIQITDKFGFNEQDSSSTFGDAESREKLYAAVSDETFGCLNGYGLVLASALFLLAQLTVITIWKTVQKRNKKDRYLYQHDNASFGTPTMVYGQPCATSTDALGKLYDSGMTGRYGQQF